MTADTIPDGSLQERRPLQQTAAVNFRYASLATEIARRCNMSRRAISRRMHIDAAISVACECSVRFSPNTTYFKRKNRASQTVVAGKLS